MHNGQYWVLNKASVGANEAHIVWFCSFLLTKKYRLFYIHFCCPRNLASFKLFAARFQVSVSN